MCRSSCMHASCQSRCAELRNASEGIYMPLKDAMMYTCHMQAMLMRMRSSTCHLLPEADEQPQLAKQAKIRQPDWSRPQGIVHSKCGHARRPACTSRSCRHCSGARNPRARIRPAWSGRLARARLNLIAGAAHGCMLLRPARIRPACYGCPFCDYPDAGQLKGEDIQRTGQPRARTQPEAKRALNVARPSGRAYC